MGKIGFSTSAVKEEGVNDNITTTDQIENYTHKIKFFGLPVFTSTKYHSIDSKVTEK